MLYINTTDAFHVHFLSSSSVAASSTGNLGVASRCLANIADVLGCLAGEGRGGLRSGPAANPAWGSAFSLLEQGDLPAGVQALATERCNWLSRSGMGLLG